ncbi:transporter, partial [Bacteroidales bacterium OttesenSCG-928-I21]|nr:transporter [Bacteroidales bacterium OttesenSCG-928-I21]
MNFFTDLFSTPSIASTMLLLSLAAFLGVIIGKIEVKKIKLGTAGVLFSSLLIAHLGAPIDEHVLHFVRDFGLILFVYGIGIDMGPRFFSSFKKDGLTLNLLAVGIVVGGFGITYLIYNLTDISPAVAVGILCGAVTNTPSLGAAQQVLAEQGGSMAASAAETGMAYALAYPFGILGIIITMLLIKLFFKIKVDDEIKDYNETLGGKETKLQSVEITVTNPNVVGKNIDYLIHILDKELAISRLFRNNEFIIPADDETIQKGDVIYGVSEQDAIENLQLKIGKVEIADKGDVEGPLAMINVLVTNNKVAGKTIEQIGIYRRYPANITRIFR